MEKVEFTTPHFLLCETPVKENSFHDHRIWIYATQALSLIEFIDVDNLTDFELNRNFKYFNYRNNQGVIESYLAVFTQDNCEITNSDRENVLSGAWSCFIQYLEQIDNYDI